MKALLNIDRSSGRIVDSEGSLVFDPGAGPRSAALRPNAVRSLFDATAEDGVRVSVSYVESGGGEAPDEETFELWTPTEGHFQNPEILEVSWSVEDGLRIGIAEDLCRSVRIWVEFAPERAFQCIDEGHRLRSIPVEPGLIWRVHGSEYIVAFRRSAARAMDSFPLIHWFVKSGNQCVDVLSESEPVLRSADAQQTAAGDARDARA